MNTNERYLNEAKSLESRWAKTGLLDGLTDRDIRNVTAVLLESQRLMNEVSVWNLPLTPTVFCPGCGAMLTDASGTWADATDPPRYVCGCCKTYYRGLLYNPTKSE